MFNGPGPRSRCALAVGAAVPLLVIACSTAIREGDTSRKPMAAQVPTRADLVGRWIRTRVDLGERAKAELAKAEPSKAEPAKADNLSRIAQRVEFEIMPQRLALKADSSSERSPFPLGVLVGRWRVGGDTLAIQWHSVRSPQSINPVQGFPPNQFRARLDDNKLILRLLPDSLQVEGVYERVDSPTGPKAP